MARLDELPHELLSQILRELRQDFMNAPTTEIIWQRHPRRYKDLYAACLICHSLLHPAREHLYTTYIVPSPKANWSLWPFIRTVTTVPTLAVHTRSLHLHFYDAKSSDPYPYPDHHHLTPKDREIIRTLHERLGLQHRRLWQHVRKSGTLHELLVAMILLVLPNVETVYLSIPPAAPVLMHCLFHCAVVSLRPHYTSCPSPSAGSDILHFANNISGLIPLLPLPPSLLNRRPQYHDRVEEGGKGDGVGLLNRVTTINFIKRSKESNLAAIVPFLLLPNLKILGSSSLHAPAGEGFPLPSPTSPPISPPASKTSRSSPPSVPACLTSLDLGTSYLDGSEIAPLLSPLRHSLRSFSYTFDPVLPLSLGFTGDDDHFDISSLNSALDQLTDHLVVLDLQASPPALLLMAAKGKNSGLDCLPRFRRLKHLTTCLQLLVGAAVTRELKDMLPAGVQTVEFVDMMSYRLGDGSGGGTRKGWFERHWPLLLLQLTEVVTSKRRREVDLEAVMGALCSEEQQQEQQQEEQEQEEATSLSRSFPYLKTLSLFDLDMVRRLRWESFSNTKHDRNPIWAALVQVCRHEGVALIGRGAATGRAVDLRWTNNEPMPG